MSEMLRLPGLIDVHVHLRDPGQTHKEDLMTGTLTALAGGYTTVVDMPNNIEPIITAERQREKIRIAHEKAVCDIGFHYGSLGDNLDTFDEAARYSVGLKLYLNNTTGGYLLSPSRLKEIYLAWPKDKVVLLHVEEDVIDIAIESMKGLNRPVHVCHMPSKEVLSKIIEAKKSGLPITCGVCPHHLFLTSDDHERLGVYADMKPSLKTRQDQAYLWSHLDDIDIFESDHAPHTKHEKEAGAFGVPGLETTLPLLLTAMKQGKITLEQIIDKCHTAPARIFNLQTDESTYIDVDMTSYKLTSDMLHTKCGWSPFENMELVGRVNTVVMRGVTVYENDNVVAPAGSGKVISE